jgi:hypothetical protein
MEASMRWAIAATLGLLALPASAAMQTDVGVLTCTLAGHGEKDTNPDSQTRAIHCAFKPKGGPEEVYVGEIKKVGSQTELNGTQVLIWAVMGPSDRKLKPAVLEQTYVGDAAGDGLSADGKPPKQLVGETDKAYALQPIADESKERNATDSVTVIQLRLKSTPT